MLILILIQFLLDKNVWVRKWYGLFLASGPCGWIWPCPPLSSPSVLLCSCPSYPCACVCYLPNRGPSQSWWSPTVIHRTSFLPELVCESGTLQETLKWQLLIGIQLYLNGWKSWMKEFPSRCEAPRILRETSWSLGPRMACSGGMCNVCNHGQEAQNVSAT